MEAFCRQRANMESEAAGFWLNEADSWKQRALANNLGKHHPKRKRADRSAIPLGASATLFSRHAAGINWATGAEKKPTGVTPSAFRVALLSKFAEILNLDTLIAYIFGPGDFRGLGTTLSQQDLVETGVHHMQITVVAVMCHTLGAITAQSVDTLSDDPVCREVIVIKNDMPMQSCVLSQAALADWKDRSTYCGDAWWISRIKCVPGDYVPKERV